MGTYNGLQLPPEREPVIIDGVRTAIGKKNGSLAMERGDHVAEAIHWALCDRQPKAIAQLSEIFFGCNSQVADCALGVARTSLFRATAHPSGLFTWKTPAVSLNRQCGSGQTSMQFACGQLIANAGQVFIAGGVEMQSRLGIGADMIWYNPDANNGKGEARTVFTHGPTAKRLNMGDQLTGAEWIAQDFLVPEWGAEKTRKMCDEYSLLSHEKAGKARDSGKFDNEIIPITLLKEMADQKNQPEPGKAVSWKGPDESIRYKQTSIEKLQALKPVLKRNGIVTAGNSCPINDGSSGVIITSRAKAQELGIKPRCRIVAQASTGCDPHYQLEGPVESVLLALKRANLKMEDMRFIEINEAFSSVILNSGLQWTKKGVPFDAMKEAEPGGRLNRWGGAIALGHPTASSACRLIITLMNILEKEGKVGDYGIATLCIGLGQGIATIIQRE